MADRGTSATGSTAAVLKTLAVFDNESPSARSDHARAQEGIRSWRHQGVGEAEKKRALSSLTTSKKTATDRSTAETAGGPKRTAAGDREEKSK
jgi:hypothetical protein